MGGTMADLLSGVAKNRSGGSVKGPERERERSLWPMETTLDAEASFTGLHRLYPSVG